MESELGCQYSVLLLLPYFDLVQMLQLDPMHNLYLGTSKMVIHKVWIEHILSPAKNSCNQSTSEANTYTS